VVFREAYQPQFGCRRAGTELGVKRKIVNRLEMRGFRRYDELVTNPTSRERRRKDGN